MANLGGYENEGVMDNELLDILRERRSSYAFLSRIYREEVSLALLKELTNLAPQEESDGGQQIQARFFAGLQRADPQKAQTDLAAEYAALFLNMGRKPVYPYESVYTSEERLLMQKARDDVVKEYAAEGLDRIAAFNEPEDHIAIELEFMAHLCQQTLGALEQGDRKTGAAYLQKQKTFLEKHLLVWAPQFCDDVLQAAQSDFYKGIAQLTKDLLASEPETIDELLKELAE